jgi:hypothetical protein
MKAIKMAVFSLLVYSGICFAGGSIGGGGGSISESVLDLADAAFNVESLPKSYIGSADFRRVKARLSVAGTESVPALVGGESVDLKTFLDSVVDVKLSKEFLPSE